MKIILEGCDGVGKSTIAEMLAEKHGCDILHMTAWGPKNYTSYLHRYDQTGLVSDRSFISEMVYSRVLGRDSKVTDEMFENLLMYVKMQGFNIVILYCDVDSLLYRLNDHSDESDEIIASLEKLQKEYVAISEKYGIPLIDTSDIDEEGVVEIIEKEILNDNSK